ncbi:MAG: DUF4830 domain-containing protein [Oscillospiraceae bacterium]|nr:DUF4830 domain-containing protein [Oscillospiraceae bacterium]
MMVMTAKVDLKKIALILGVIAAVIVGLILLVGGNDTQTTSAEPVSNNDARVKFLTSFGWEVASSPEESGQVRIPEEMSEVFDRYNKLQKTQGYDLSTCAGKNVMRYVYKVKNYPGATEPVYATVLVYKNQIIGGDITDTSAGGKVQGFKMNKGNPTATTPAATTPVTTAPAST